MKKIKNYPVVKITNPCKLWWSGGLRVEPYMVNVSLAIEKHVKDLSARIEIYNRCYEAIFDVLLDYSTVNKTT